MTNIMYPLESPHRHQIVTRLFLTRKLSIVSVLIVLIFFSILVAGGFLAAFLWSVRSGQYDDDYTPSVRMLFDDPPSNNTTTSSSFTQNGNNAS
jgi:cbb3-type cytochrome oxidase maturation protein